MWFRLAYWGKAVRAAGDAESVFRRYAFVCLLLLRAALKLVAVGAEVLVVFKPPSCDFACVQYWRSRQWCNISLLWVFLLLLAAVHAVLQLLVVLVSSQLVVSLVGIEKIQQHV